MKALFSFLLVIACIYGAIVWAAWKYQHRLVFFPDKQLYATPQQIGLPYEDVAFRAADGVSLHGWFIPVSKDRRKGTLLFFHGNAGNVSHRLDSIRLFNQLGLDVFIIDYRGYGQSEGEISEEGSYLDAQAAWEHLTQERGILAKDIFLFGRSLGGGVAAELASRVRAKGVILESTFTSIIDVGKKAYPLLPVKFLSNIHYANKDKIAKIEIPILIVHSKDDDLIPYAHGEELFRLTAGKGEFLTINGDHNNGFLSSGRTYTEGLFHFID